VRGKREAGLKKKKNLPFWGKKGATASIPLFVDVTWKQSGAEEWTHRLFGEGENGMNWIFKSGRRKYGHWRLALEGPFGKKRWAASIRSSLDSKGDLKESLELDQVGPTRVHVTKNNSLGLGGGNGLIVRIPGLGGVGKSGLR